MRSRWCVVVALVVGAFAAQADARVPYRVSTERIARLESAELVALVDVDPSADGLIKRSWLGALKASSRVAITNGLCDVRYYEGPVVMALAKEGASHVCVELWSIPGARYWGPLQSVGEDREPLHGRRWSGAVATQLKKMEREAQALERALIKEVKDALAAKGCEPKPEWGGWIMWPDGRREYAHNAARYHFSGERAVAASRDALLRHEDGCEATLFAASYRGPSIEGQAVWVSMEGGGELRGCGELCVTAALQAPQLPPAQLEPSPSAAWRCHYEGQEAVAGEDAQTRALCAARWRDAQGVAARLGEAGDAVDTSMQLAQALARWPKDDVGSLMRSLGEAGLAVSEREALWLLTTKELPLMLELSPWRLHAQALLLLHLEPERRREALGQLYIAQDLALGQSGGGYDAPISQLRAQLTPEEIAAAQAHRARWADAIIFNRQVQRQRDKQQRLKQESAAREPARMEEERRRAALEAQQQARVTPAPAAEVAPDAKEAASAEPDSERGLRDGLLVAIAAFVVVLAGLMIKKVSRA